MDILVVAQYFGNIEQLEKSNSRFLYLSVLFSQKHSVEVLTTSFVHIKKKQATNIPKEYKGVKITALSQPVYKKNVCLKRLYSNKVLAKKMSKYLASRQKPDLIYCAVPSLDSAYIAAKYAKKNNIPFVIDIQDLWPEAFKMVLPFPRIWDVLLYGMKKKANYIYASADSIIGVSETYCRRASDCNKKAKYFPIFLGTEIDKFDYNCRNNHIDKPVNTFLIIYSGTLGNSYDLKCVFDAMEIVKNRGKDNVGLWIIGDGPMMDEFKTYSLSKDINVSFFGRVPYDQMCGYLVAGDVCINPIRKGTAASIINKHADYAASGLPVINTQETPEYKNLIHTYKSGINCNCSDAHSVADAIIYLMEHKDERIQMGINSRKMAEELFDRKTTYKKIENVISSFL